MKLFSQVLIMRRRDAKLNPWTIAGRIGWALLFFVVSPMNQAAGEVTISVADGTIQAGGQLMVEVGINSDNATDDLLEYFLILRITELDASGDSSLQFVDPQSEAVLDDSDYVLASSSEVNFELNDGFDASTIFEFGSDELTLVDLSVDALGDLSTTLIGQNKLLAIVDLTHVLGSASAASTNSNRFEISVEDGTEILDDFGNNLFNLDLVSNGVITVTAIPEPGSVAVLSLMVVGCAVQRRRRRSLILGDQNDFAGS